MKPNFIMPEEREARPEWSAVPQNIVQQIEVLVGDTVISGETVWGGYTNSACFKIELASGVKVFAKGTHPDQDAHGVQTVRQEVYAYQNIPGIEKISPAFRGTVSDGDEDGWTLIVFDYLEAENVLRWGEVQTTRAFMLLKHIHSLQESALPKGFPVAETTNYIERYFKPEGGWLRIANEEKVQKKFLSLFQNEEEGKRWLNKVLPALCNLQNDIQTLRGHRGVAHMDLRTDNVLFTKENAYLVDWPNMCFGPVVVDVVEMVADIAVVSDSSAPYLLDLYKKTTGIVVEDKDLALALASVSGHLADVAYRQKPKKAPRLPWMRKRRLWEMLVWMVDVLQLSPPPMFRV